MAALTDGQIQALFASGVVRHGPFAGLRYPVLTSVGSALYPKLLGSYEREIQGWIEEVCAAKYSEIVDVGCAEGYYAVGLARRLPQARVYAYDIDPLARELCTQMARANRVGRRVEVRERFQASELATIPVRRRGLLVCDCEGAESTIFTARTCRRFADWDLLIETHDFLDITISTELVRLFHRTHELRQVLSVDDIQKAKHYEYPELAGLDLATRRLIVAEYRPTLMEWQFHQAHGSQRTRRSARVATPQRPTPRRGGTVRRAP